MYNGTAIYCLWSPLFSEQFQWSNQIRCVRFSLGQCSNASHLKRLWYKSDRSLGWPESWSGHSAEEKNLLTLLANEKSIGIKTANMRVWRTEERSKVRRIKVSKSYQNLLILFKLTNLRIIKFLPTVSLHSLIPWMHCLKSSQVHALAGHYDWDCVPTLTVSGPIPT